MIVEWRHMRLGEARNVALLHRSSITDSFLNRLGLRFLACLYRGIQQDPSSHVWVAHKNRRVVGFCAYAQNVTGLYRRVLRRRLVRLALASLPSSLNPWILKEVIDTLRYPAKQEAQQLPAAEILSIAVDPEGRNSGIGKRLLNEALAQAKADGETSVKVLAGAELKGANQFYESNGFEERCQIEQHGHSLNVFVKALVLA